MLWFSKIGKIWFDSMFEFISKNTMIDIQLKFDRKMNFLLLLNGTKMFPVIHVAHCATTKLKPFGHKTHIFWSIFSPFKADTISFPRRQDLKPIQYQITNLIYVFLIIHLRTILPKFISMIIYLLNTSSYIKSPSESVIAIFCKWFTTFK